MPGIFAIQYLNAQHSTGVSLTLYRGQQIKLVPRKARRGCRGARRWILNNVPFQKCSRVARSKSRIPNPVLSVSTPSNAAKPGRDNSIITITTKAQSKQSPTPPVPLRCQQATKFNTTSNLKSPPLGTLPNPCGGLNYKVGRLGHTAYDVIIQNAFLLSIKQ